MPLSFSYPDACLDTKSSSHLEQVLGFYDRKELRVYDNSDMPEPLLVASGMGDAPPEIYYADVWSSISEAAR
jgi:hypothetical protein